MVDGFLFIDKPRGLTSRKVCNQISFKLGERKVGHIGTLDPFATGLLIVTLGKGNKAGQFLEKENKTYIATLNLGKETDTLDDTGTFIKEENVPNLNKEIIENCFKKFVGKISQIPPMTSAIHVNGTKLYKLAHQGIEIEREPREVEINYIKLISFSHNQIVFECNVSSGTYIRVLAKDIAHALSTCGYLTELRRIKIGNFSIDQSVELEKADTNDVINITSTLQQIGETVVACTKEAQDISNGKVLEMNYESSAKYLFVKNKNNEPIAMYAKIDKNKYIFKRGLF